MDSELIPVISEVISKWILNDVILNHYNQAQNVIPICDFICFAVLYMRAIFFNFFFNPQYKDRRV